MATLQESFAGTTDDFFRNYTTTIVWAQTFTASANYVLYSIKCRQFRIGSPGNMTMAVKATDGTLPTGADLCSLSQSANGFTTSTTGNLEEFIFTSPPSLVSGTKYAFTMVIDVTGTPAVKEVDINVKSTGGYSGGQMYNNTAGAGWVQIGTDYDCDFEVWGTVSGGAPAVQQRRRFIRHG